MTPPSSSDARASDDAAISVLIATRDRPESLGRCLSSVLENAYPNFEVIVVDQSTSRASERLVSDVADRRVRYVRQDAVGLSLARNTAMAEATGSIFAFTDDDCTVPPRWLDRIAGVFASEGNAGLVFGAFRAIPHDPALFYVPSFSPPNYRRLNGRMATRFGRREAGGNMAGRRSAFAVVGGFDVCLGAGATFPGGDDTDVNDRILRAGFDVIHDPQNVVLHWGARAYADGTARELLLGGSLARGAILAKEVRLGDPLALYRLGLLIVGDGSVVAWNAVSRRRPTGAARFRSTMVGFWRGLRHPLLRDRRVFAERSKPPRS